ncbi:protein-L-isoaspartate(D-aspartate) O-methyltransferase [Synechocystis sp. LKSZ1]|uniref:protein-L-isoaspartate(D-aspartate) O-methyltransferase n=1 Tax=Synechocystis sp. LKSZ1 TaxID=3144951 RepID=UPI00336BF345
MSALALLPFSLLRHRGEESYPGIGEEKEFTEQAWQEKRQEMVEEQIVARGIKEPLVLKALEKVPRHQFVPPRERYLAYIDSALSIGYQQTISQPYIVAYMTEKAEIKAEDKVLEVGTGCGYQAAILGEIAKEVYSIEIIHPLAEEAQKILRKLGYQNIHIKVGDGYQGWSEKGPYDAIIVTAAPDHIPPALIEQLAVGGKMIIPVGEEYQEIVIVTKKVEGIKQQRTIPVRFVPLTRKIS